MSDHNELYAASEDFLDRIVWEKDHGADVLIVRSTEGSDERQAAIINIVAQISDERFWLLHDRGWLRPTEVNRTLEGVKATAVIKEPLLFDLRDAFKKGFDNIVATQDLVRHPSCLTQRAVTISSGRIQVRFPLFKEREEGISPYPDEHLRATYPKGSRDFNDALARNNATHELMAIPAFNIHGDPITPEHYRKELQGADVNVGFTLTHYTIMRKEKPIMDTYVADIVRIDVLTPPKPKIQRPAVPPPPRRGHYKVAHSGFSHNLAFHRKLSDDPMDVVELPPPLIPAIEPVTNTIAASAPARPTDEPAVELPLTGSVDDTHSGGKRGFSIEEADDADVAGTKRRRVAKK